MLTVICLGTTRTEVLEPRCAKYAPENAEELLSGEKYIVYGQCLVESCLLYLIDPILKGQGRPFWYPSSLFSVCDARLSHKWWFMHYPKRDFSGNVEAVWGYEELVKSSEHFIGLMERNPKAMKVFMGHKITTSKT